MKDAARYWALVESNWKQLAGQAKAQWGKFTDEELTAIAGRREQFMGKLQEHYALSTLEVERQMAQWARKASEPWFKKPPENGTPS